MRYLFVSLLIILLPIAAGAVISVIGGAIWDIAEDFEEGWKDGMD